MTISDQKLSKHCDRVENYRIFLMIENIDKFKVQLLTSSLAEKIDFKDSFTSEAWRDSESNFLDTTSNELAARVDIHLDGQEALDSIIEDLTSRAWYIDSESKLYFTIFYLDKAPFTFHSFINGSI